MLFDCRQAVSVFVVVLGSLVVSAFGIDATADERVADLAVKIADDIEQWTIDTTGDPVSDKSRDDATDLLIRLLVEADELAVADSVAHRLHRQYKYWGAVHPELLSEGRFEEAAEIATDLVENNPRMRSFVIADTFFSIATLQSLDKGFAYLDRQKDISDYDTRSALSGAFIKVARHYDNLGDEFSREQALSRIESSHDREIAKAVLVARNSVLDESQIQPLFLRVLEGRSTARRNSRCRRPWYVRRIKAYSDAASGRATTLANYNRTVAAEYSTRSLSPSDRVIGTGLDLITASLCKPEPPETNSDDVVSTIDSKIVLAVATTTSSSDDVSPKQVASELSTQFDGVIADGFTRSWIAYTLSRSGHWTTEDVKRAWSARQKYENPEWIIGFAAGFDESGRGKTIQRLVDLTKTTNARCFLRLGQLISRVSAKATSSAVPRQAMK